MHPGRLPAVGLDRVVAVLGLAGVVAAMTAGPLVQPALAAPPPPDPKATVQVLSVSRLTVHAGDVVRISGRGCRPGERVDVSVFSPNPQPAGSLVAGMAGLFGASVRLPRDAQPGRLWIRATCPGANNLPWVLDATLAVRSPAVVITWVNVLFGLGAALAVVGFGLAGRRRRGRGPGRRRPETPTMRSRAKLARRHKRRKRAAWRTREVPRP